MRRQVPFELPTRPDPALLPRLASAAQLARIHDAYWGPISASAIRTWPLYWSHRDGHLVGEVSAFLIEAERRADDQSMPSIVEITRRHYRGNSASPSVQPTLQQHGGGTQ
jgi:hypothetical protein